MSSKDWNEKCLTQEKSNSIEWWLIMNQIKLLKNLFGHFFIGIKQA